MLVGRYRIENRGVRLQGVPVIILLYFLPHRPNPQGGAPAIGGKIHAQQNNSKRAYRQVGPAAYYRILDYFHG